MSMSRDLLRRCEFHNGLESPRLVRAARLRGPGAQRRPAEGAASLMARDAEHAIHTTSLAEPRIAFDIYVEAGSV